MRVVGRVTKKLLCPQCDDVLADVSYRPLAWSLTLVAPDGRPLVPQQGSIHVRRAEQQLASASSPAEEQQARERLQDIKRRLGELMYDLPCHRGHHTVATAPQITRALRRGQGDWVRLS